MLLRCVRCVRYARLAKWGTGLPMMYPCDLIEDHGSLMWSNAAEIQQRWLAWRPPCSKFWGRWTGGTVTPLGSRPLTSGIQTPFDQLGVPESAPGAAKSHFPVFPSVSGLSLERSLQRLWNGLTDVVLLHAVCTRLSPPDRSCRVFLCSNQMCGDAQEIEGRRALILCSSSCAAP